MEDKAESKIVKHILDDIKETKFKQKLEFLKEAYCKNWLSEEGKIEYNNMLRQQKQLKDTKALDKYKEHFNFLAEGMKNLNPCSGCKKDIINCKCFKIR